MRICLGIDQLGVAADALARSANATFQHIAYTQLVPNLSGVDRLAPIGERGISRDHETAFDPRQVGRQILGDPLRKNCCSRSSLRLAKGSTTIDRCGVLGGCGMAAAGGALAAGREATASGRNA